MTGLPMGVAFALVVLSGSPVAPERGASPADTLPALERGYELLRGDQPAEARGPLMEAVPTLPSARGTTVLRLVSLLDRVEEPADRLAAQAFLAIEDGEPEEALRILEEGLEEAREEDRAPLLALAADAADRFDRERSVQLRTRLFEQHPDALETVEAAIALARYHSATLEGAEEALAILEAVIVARPNHPLAPEARRHFERLRERVRREGGFPR